MLISKDHCLLKGTRISWGEMVDFRYGAWKDALGMSYYARKQGRAERNMRTWPKSKELPWVPFRKPSLGIFEH